MDTKKKNIVSGKEWNRKYILTSLINIYILISKANRIEYILFCK